jgi:hypothetical protein
MTDSVPTAAEPRPAAGSRRTLVRLRATAVERLKTFAKAHELSLLLAIAAASMLAYLSLGPASGAMPVAAAPAAAKRTAPAPAVAVKAPAPVVFPVRALVISGGKTREHDARLALGRDLLSVTTAEGPQRLLQSLEYERVRSITYSHGRDPMRNTPQGPVSVRKRGGALGKLGLFVDRHWIVLESERADRYVILRVDDRSVTRVLDVLAVRTGRRPGVIASP